MNEGLLGLIHLCFLLPGAAIGSLIAIFLVYRKRELTGFKCFLYGFGGFFIGAIIGMLFWFSDYLF